MEDDQRTSIGVQRVTASNTVTRMTSLSDKLVLSGSDIPVESRDLYLGVPFKTGTTVTQNVATNVLTIPYKTASGPFALSIDISVLQTVTNTPGQASLSKWKYYFAFRTNTTEQNAIPVGDNTFDGFAPTLSFSTAVHDPVLKTVTLRVLETNFTSTCTCTGQYIEFAV